MRRSEYKNSLGSARTEKPAGVIRRAFVIAGLLGDAAPDHARGGPPTASRRRGAPGGRVACLDLAAAMQIKELASPNKTQSNEMLCTKKPTTSSPQRRCRRMSFNIPLADLGRPRLAVLCAS